MVLKIFCTMMVKGLRLGTVSFETKAITLTIFLAQFINTCVLLTLKNFNVSEIFGKDHYLSKVFNGKDSDFTEHWYKTVGTAITMTMLIQSMAPVITFCSNYCILNFMRLLDRGCSCGNTSTTRQTSVKQYLDLHSGPEWALNQRFSQILLQISVTALFGASLPLLYPIGVLSFTVSIVVEKLNLCYFYKEPPMYDESITRTSNFVIKILVYVGLFLTAWQLGNKQIFENNPGSTLILQLDILHSHHTLSEQLRQANPFHLTYGSPPMVLFLILTLYLVLRELVVIFRHHALKKPVAEKDEEQLDEGLAPYFVALDQNDYDCFVGQEQHF